jgi:hypothetical protein
MRKYFTQNISLENSIPEGEFVFLGGTCNESKWRAHLITLLDVEYFNPVTEDWNDATIEREEEAKKKAKALLYIITPKQTGFYSFVEMTLSACLATNKDVIIGFIEEDDTDLFSESQKRSINAIIKLLEDNTDIIHLDTLESIANHLNNSLSTYK